jgi:hypothetical protein
MQHRTVFLMLLAITLLAIMVGCSSGGSAADGGWTGLPGASIPVGDATVAGLITDQNAQPAASASVRLMSGSKITASTLTDRDGRYQMVAKAGSYTIAVEKEGYASVTQNINLPENEVIPFNTVISSDIGVVYGEVTNSKNGEKLAGVSLQVVSTTNPLLEISPVITDKIGTYRLSLSPGTYEITATLDGYDTASASITLAALQTFPKNFELSRTSGRLFGRITDQAQTPQKDAFIRVVSVDGNLPGAEATTADDGQYSFYLLEGKYNISVTKSGFNKYETDTPIDIVADTEKNKDIQLIPPSEPVALIGEVILNTTDEPLANISVDLTRNGEFLESTLTTPEGKFIFQNHSAGMYSIGLAKNSQNYNPATYVVHILDDGKLSPEEPRLYLSAKVLGEDETIIYHPLATGTVSDAFTGAPLQYVDCSIKGVGATFTDNNGKFSFANLVPGTYELTLARNGWQTFVTNFTVRLKTNNASETEILPSLLNFSMSQSPEIDRGSVAGRYVNETTGDGVDGLIVRIYKCRLEERKVTIGLDPEGVPIQEDVAEWTLYSAAPSAVVSTRTDRTDETIDTAGSFRLEHIEPSTLPQTNPADEVAGYVVYVGEGTSHLEGIPWYPYDDDGDPNTSPPEYVWYRPGSSIEPGAFRHRWDFVKVKPNTTTYLHNYDKPNYTPDP